MGYYRSSHPEVFLEKSVLKICSKFTGEHPCRSMMSMRLLCNFIEITLRHECSPVNLLHILRTPFTKNTYGRLLLILESFIMFNLLLVSNTIFFCLFLFLIIKVKNVFENRLPNVKIPLT